MRLKNNQIELLYSKYTPREMMSLNIIEVDEREMVANSIHVRAEEIPAFLDAVAEFERAYRLKAVGEE